MCQSVPGQYGDPARLPVRHVLPRQDWQRCTAACTSKNHFHPLPPAKRCGHWGINGKQTPMSTWSLSGVVALQVGSVSPMFTLQSYIPGCQNGCVCMPNGNVTYKQMHRDWLTHTCERTHFSSHTHNPNLSSLSLVPWMLAAMATHLRPPTLTSPNRCSLSHL